MTNDDGGGFDWGGFLMNQITSPNGGMSSMIPSLTAAWNQYNNSGKYTDLGQRAADLSNPAGDRGYYRDQLRASYDDPTAFLNNPGHQIEMKRGLDQVTANNAMKGYLGSGNMAVDLSKYASDSNATYLDKERERMANLAGFQFDPANAGKMLMEGGRLSIDSQNKALESLFSQFNNKNGNPAAGGRNPDGSLKGPSFPSIAPPGWSQSAWDQLKGNFTTNPDAPGGGGYNGTGDGPAGPGGDAPGSGGPQYQWPHEGDNGGRDDLDLNGGAGYDNSNLDNNIAAGGYHNFAPDGSYDFSKSLPTNWDNIDFSRFSDANWDSFLGSFGDYNEFYVGF